MTTIDVSPLVAECATPGVQLERRTAGAIDAYGEAAAPAAVLSALTCWIHDANGRDLLRLPEADRQRATIKIGTTTMLRVASGSALADVIRYQSKRWEVVNVQDYAAQGGVYMTLAQLMETSA